MNDEEQLIKVFYTCFQQRDWKGMISCYQQDIFFYDPVFQNLEGAQVRGMWEMLLSSAKDLKIEFNGIRAEDGYGSCQWTAEYHFSQTGRWVVNRGTAQFAFRQGKMAEHQDNFDLWKWSRQALGLPGILLGWTPVLQDKIRRKARRSLDKFMVDHPGSHSLPAL